MMVKAKSPRIKRDRQRRAAVLMVIEGRPILDELIHEKAAARRQFRYVL
jgi:hypothetical protein